ncbi:MAG TPA: ferrous iron transport protein B, partial [Tepidisphaeraceae bacterium]|nr:ferrous iron transport protein B [Tepidisphaeraceae bacterium]
MSTATPTPIVLSAKAAGALTLALAGNPNSGKTTIFNALTGLRQKVANYPGVTVEKKTGRCYLPDGTRANVIDLPGTYSLVSRSPDEVVAMEVLRGLRKDTPAPDVVIVVVDASNLQRNLYLVSQLIELGRPMVVALNMMDVAARRGLTVSAERLQQQLGVPVVAVVGHKGRGVDDLKAAVARATIAPMPDWPLPAAMKEQVTALGRAVSLHPPLAASRTDAADRLTHAQVLAERLLVGDRTNELGAIAKDDSVRTALTAAESRLAQLGIDPMQADIEAHYHWIDAVAAAASDSVAESRATSNEQRATLPYAPKPTFTQQLDRVLVHKFFGLLIFAAVMAALFVSIFWLADPIMGACEEIVGWLGGFVTDSLPDGPVRDLWSDGIVAGVGGVVVFVPQIAMLFLFLAIMEDSGYLARAAFLMDRVLAKVGLHGKSFIPLLSSFACAIPGIMATRTIENRKDRLATILVAPFMSCSARLPVYTLLIGSFFAG